MKDKSALPPPEHRETVRREIREFLEEGPATAREISAGVRIPEREVANHLEHLRLSLHAEGRRLDVIPPECLGCGFLFRNRRRFTRPGKCPSCGGTHLREPRFEIG